MRSVSVIGIGETKMGKLVGKSLRDLIAEAGNKAIDDAGIEKERIQALYLGNFNSSYWCTQSHMGPMAALGFFEKGKGGWAVAVVESEGDGKLMTFIEGYKEGTYLCTRAVVNTFIEQKSGVILNTSSIVGIYGNFGQTNYAASKFGVIGFTKTLIGVLSRML